MQSVSYFQAAPKRRTNAQSTDRTGALAVVYRSVPASARPEGLVSRQRRLLSVFYGVKRSERVIWGIFYKAQGIDAGKSRIILILSFFHGEDSRRPLLIDYCVKLDPFVVRGSFFCCIKCQNSTCHNCL
ncbi:hypothetical protein HJG60_008372 [Phyllostomus discolor]|uniref:Uncharacterized protein n=1 Tax=Phyllostomus discolor TaxID=89673 RepID=A0A834DM71_9CHIR|nr:hypothetical protein HJG60_008372 [Phyllostomus discolor]